MAMGNAVPWDKFPAAALDTNRQNMWAQCKEIASSPQILDRFAEQLPCCGVVSEEGAAKLIYLVVTSYFLKQPVSLAVTGPSSASKSYITEQVLRFFPPEAYYALSAMSERALAYSDEPLAHRFLVL